MLNDFSKEEIPSVVTIHNILKRNGLVCPQKRLRRVKPVYPIFDPKECNEVWSADYKGKFLMGNKIYCHPLTIADSKSRFLFTAKGHYHETLKLAKAEFTKVFRKFGIPKQLHTDNGSPFGSVRAIQRFTQLSYWFIELGIMPVFSDPAHPEQNGRHERMHRDLKAACAKPSAYDLKAQQRRLNHFVKEYNNIRPHEALAMETEEDRRSRVMRGRDIVEDLKSGKYPEIYSPREEPEAEKNGKVVSIVSDEAARKSEEVETKEARNARLAEGKTKKEEIEKGLKKDFPEMFKDRK